MVFAGRERLRWRETKKERKEREIESKKASRTEVKKGRNSMYR